MDVTCEAIRVETAREVYTVVRRMYWLALRVEAVGEAAGEAVGEGDTARGYKLTHASSKHVINTAKLTTINTQPLKHKTLVHYWNTRLFGGS